MSAVSRRGFLRSLVKPRATGNAAPREFAHLTSDFPLAELKREALASGYAGDPEDREAMFAHIGEAMAKQREHPTADIEEGKHGTA